jgi:hypothetical protein
LIKRNILKFNVAYKTWQSYLTFHRLSSSLRQTRSQW